MPHKRLHVFYSGRVQGVGFRWTTQDIASRLNLTGWVKNLEDGKVEVVCEGEEKQLKAFLDDMATGFLSPYIKDTDVSWNKATQEFKGFDVRF